MAAVPLKKKRKQEIAEIFPKFRRNKKKLLYLSLAIKALFEGQQEMNLRALHIKETDARSSKNFTRATCDTLPYDYEDSRDTVPIFTVGSVYSYGLHVLKQYISGEKIRLPRKDTTIRRALQKLLEYITPDNAPTELTSATRQTELNEADFAVLLAQHLLSKLAVGSTYTIENHYLHKLKETGRCSCKAHEPLLGTFGDTSFGCPQAWHGSPDILIDLVTVKVAAELSGDEDDRCAGRKNPPDDTCDGSSVEANSSDGFNEDDLSQMKAQTIVFSFLQKKQDGQLNNYLIPSVGISKNKLIVHFYDCVNDVLLSSTNLDLFVDMGNNVITFNYPVILFLWLTLNYRLFCSGPTEEMKKFKSNFCSHVGQKYVEMYENQVERPCRWSRKPEESGNWAKMWGRQGTIESEIDYEDFTDEET